jgi:hypothetical protein
VASVNQTWLWMALPISFLLSGLLWANRGVTGQLANLFHRLTLGGMAGCVDAVGYPVRDIGGRAVAGGVGDEDPHVGPPTRSGGTAGSGR